MPTITLMPRPLQPHPPHGQEPLHYMGNNPTGHPGVNPTNYSLLTPHPAQSHSGEMMTPAHSWIGPPPSAYPISLVPGVNNHQPWAPSPTGSNSRPSVSSQTSSLESAALSHEELQNTLQSVARALQLGYELVQWAQPLLEMSPEARNMALQTCITPNPVVVPAQLPAKPPLINSSARLSGLGSKKRPVGSYLAKTSNHMAAEPLDACVWRTRCSLGSR
ncbi:hypothetical protein PtB15_5B164 [Puccinia triticina]|nr:hypothetical protein PtB15_5B164 [Puccinia triticina]